MSWLYNNPPYNYQLFYQVRLKDYTLEELKPGLVRKRHFTLIMYYYTCFVIFFALSMRSRNQKPSLKGRYFRGTQRQFSEKYLFGRRFEIWNFRNICCKSSCLPASPSIFEHLKNGIIAYF